MPPRIDPTLCDGCGICVFDCGAFVLTMDPRRNIAKLTGQGKGCVDCFICEFVCPEHAITMKVGKRYGHDG